jgi:protein-S-isoprenylcysteine O-methyltransferase Ste14
MASLPRPVVALIWAVGVPFVHCVIPVELSSVSTRWGWTDGHPSVWNLALGALAAIAGGMFLTWAVVLHLISAPRNVPVQFTAINVIDRGPYAFSRNPMYVGELVLWLGWALVFGSWPVAVGFFALWTAIAIVIVPWEESSLESKFGADYVAYRDRTSRWLGRR